MTVEHIAVENLALESVREGGRFERGSGRTSSAGVRSARVFGAVACVALAAGLFGCRTTSSPEHSTASDDEMRDERVVDSNRESGLSEARDAGPPTVWREVVGSSVEGRPIEVVVIEGEPDAETVWILATIHGDEWAGTPLLAAYVDAVTAAPNLTGGHRVVLTPVANPDGYAAHRRTNVRGVDLNRNFPADNFVDRRGHGEAPLSEPESRALKAVFDRFQPHRVVSLHQPLRCIDYDGPAEAIARGMAEVCALPVRKLGGRDGSLGSWVGIKNGVPIVTVEFARGDERFSADQLYAMYGEMLHRAVVPRIE